MAQHSTYRYNIHRHTERLKLKEHPRKKEKDEKTPTALFCHFSTLQHQHTQLPGRNNSKTAKTISSAIEHARAPGSPTAHRYRDQRQAKHGVVAQCLRKGTVRLQQVALLLVVAPERCSAPALLQHFHVLSLASGSGSSRERTERL